MKQEIEHIFSRPVYEAMRRLYPSYKFPELPEIVIYYRPCGDGWVPISNPFGEY